MANSNYFNEPADDFCTSLGPTGGRVLGLAMEDVGKGIYRMTSNITMFLTDIHLVFPVRPSVLPSVRQLIVALAYTQSALLRLLASWLAIPHS